MGLIIDVDEVTHNFTKEPGKSEASTRVFNKVK